jgi:hypothetical protein
MKGYQASVSPVFIITANAGIYHNSEMASCHNDFKLG